MHLHRIFSAFLLPMIVNIMVANGEEYDADSFCSLLPDNTKIASIESCQKYYVCQKGQAIETVCASSSYSFDKNAQICKPSYQVQCAGSVVIEEPTCASIVNGYLPVPYTCTDYMYCENGVKIGETSCPNGLTFNKDRCDYSECIISGTNQLLFSSCDVIPNNVFFGSTVDCSEYHLCFNDEFHTNTCPDGSQVNIQEQVCSWPSAGDYCDHVLGYEILPYTTPLLRHAEQQRIPQLQHA